MDARDQLRQLLEEGYAAFASGDPTVWAEHTADDVLGIGTDSDEWWQGRDVVARVTTEQMQEISKAGGSVTAGQPHIFERGDVVWAVDRPTLYLGDGTTVPMRVTLIADAEAGGLRIRHFHFSVGADNEQVFGQELTTA